MVKINKAQLLLSVGVITGIVLVSLGTMVLNAQPIVASNDLSSIVDKMKTASNGVKSYRYEEQVQSIDVGTGSINNLTIDATCILPDTLMLVSTDGVNQLEYIVKDGQFYGNQNIGTNSWSSTDWVSTYGNINPCAFTPDSFVKSFERMQGSEGKIEFLADDLVDNSPCIHVRLHDTIDWSPSFDTILSKINDPTFNNNVEIIRALDAHLNMSCDVWIGKQDYLPRQIELKTNFDEPNWQQLFQDANFNLVQSVTTKLEDYNSENIQQSLIPNLSDLVAPDSVDLWCVTSWYCDESDFGELGTYCTLYENGWSFCVDGWCEVSTYHFPAFCNELPCACQDGIWGPFCSNCDVPGWCMCVPHP